MKSKSASQRVSEICRGESPGSSFGVVAVRGEKQIPYGDDRKKGKSKMPLSLLIQAGLLVR